MELYDGYTMYSQHNKIAYTHKNDLADFSSI